MTNEEIKARLAKARASLADANAAIKASDGEIANLITSLSGSVPIDPVDPPKPAIAKGVILHFGIRNLADLNAIDPDDMNTLPIEGFTITPTFEFDFGNPDDLFDVNVVVNTLSKFKGMNKHIFLNALHYNKDAPDYDQPRGKYLDKWSRIGEAVAKLGFAGILADFESGVQNPEAWLSHFGRFFSQTRYDSPNHILSTAGLGRYKGRRKIDVINGFLKYGSDIAERLRPFMDGRSLIQLHGMYSGYEPTKWAGGLPVTTEPTNYISNPCFLTAFKKGLPKTDVWCGGQIYKIADEEGFIHGTKFRKEKVVKGDFALSGYEQAAKDVKISYGIYNFPNWQGNGMTVEKYGRVVASALKNSDGMVWAYLENNDNSTPPTHVKHRVWINSIAEARRNPA